MTNQESLCCTDFYERPDGTIVKSYGFTGDNILLYNQHGKHFTAPEKEVRTWKPRKDLCQFPGSPDEPLPYVFDLLMDVKWVSSLPECDDEDRDDLMAQHGITMEHAREVRAKFIEWCEQQSMPKA